MFGKKKQKQETLVRMRNLAQLDEGFFAHMKDGKDMFDATAREIRETYQQLGAGITQIQENIKEASQMAADNGEKEQELTGQLASYQEQEVQSSEKREQMLQNFAQIEQEMAQLVEENKHFTTPSKFLNEFPVALKAENERPERNWKRCRIAESRWECLPSMRRLKPGVWEREENSLLRLQKRSVYLRERMMS